MPPRAHTMRASRSFPTSNLLGPFHVTNSRVWTVSVCGLAVERVKKHGWSVHTAGRACAGAGRRSRRHRPWGSHRQTQMRLRAGP